MLLNIGHCPRRDFPFMHEMNGIGNSKNGLITRREIVLQKIKDVMTTDVECCSLLDNIYEVAVKMRDLDVGAIPIVDNERLVGMITDRDLVIRGIAEKRPGSTRVQEIMSENLITVSKETSVQEAMRLMAEHQIRRLPVVEDGKLVGIVSLGDFAVRKHTDEQAGMALSEISEPSEIQDQWHH